MIPITFWASLVPWLKEKIPDDTSCSRRNQRSTLDGTWRRTIQAVATMTAVPRTIPMIGDSTMKTTILMMPLATSPDGPSAGSVAPIIPPASACEDDDGRPHHQVARFQAMAPTRDEKITASTNADPCALSRSNWMIPFPIVLATWSPPPNAAMKLKNAAQATATVGASTRVETTVAIELAASWKPLRK